MNLKKIKAHRLARQARKDFSKLLLSLQEGTPPDWGVLASVAGSGDVETTIEEIQSSEAAWRAKIQRAVGPILAQKIFNSIRPLEHAAQRGDLPQLLSAAETFVDRLALNSAAVQREGVPAADAKLVDSFMLRAAITPLFIGWIRIYQGQAGES